MNVKKSLLILALTVSLSGCTVTGADLETPPQEESSPSAAYELLITELERELEALLAERESMSETYEARIRELEALLAKQESGEGENAPSESPFAFEEVENGLELVAYHGQERRVTVPQSVNGRHVVAIGEGAFRSTAVEEVILPDGLLEIGWFAFSGCYRLRQVVLPASLSEIGYGAFEYCSSALCFQCPSDSYAAEYARSYGIAVKDP